MFGRFAGLGAAVLLALPIMAGAAERGSVTGRWVGSMDDNHHEMNLEASGSYSSTMKIMGMDFSEKGEWELSGNQLKLHRKVEIDPKGEKPAPFTFVRTILKADGKELVTEHESAIGSKLVSSYRRP